ncbi:CDP-diacylglycerol-glycerol-3-phosphate 3-phosphatidyltransferase domain protein [Mycobacterium kansasii]|uniref:CDP-diacylglycerol-glycerol-3-phosphate 3-phosphatidyltransferase domain protein n=1 Tax=Mycobacterium kansasii TaxID=1768 RepID=A0A1V3XSL3_MYCKA|nr:CDP-diacylglycerol-glycerol-3-phosphate 3-phosphatidyltransferase domain protein [Mycobacterium kansasii]
MTHQGRSPNIDRPISAARSGSCRQWDRRMRRIRSPCRSCGPASHQTGR